ncbi:MAG: hypothetical protein Q9182_006522 [Xanthomendoza sp. 2 TL-2023]
MGGTAEVGSNSRLLLLLYEPDSDQDREIERDLRETGTATARDTRGNDFREAWGSSLASAESEASMTDDIFAELLSVDGEPHDRARVGGVGAAASSHVGAADPQIRNIGDGWVLDYVSVRNLVPVDRAAAGLKDFYKHVIDLAADRISSGTPPAISHGFNSKRFSLRLKSTRPIPWKWVIRFARFMSHAADAKWSALYEITMNSTYWDSALIRVALVALQ